ncbi:hypothetical protein K5D40_15255 [Pseudomonas cichorii]|nr:hypothetical protein [Pseudomonas cichorii]MBX8603580.1 hypothetical protein [Pseudomonas cichorii]
MYRLLFLLLAVITLGGCTSFNQIGRADESRPLSKDKAAIVGFVSEGFLTQPHGLHVMLRYQDPNKDAMQTLIALETMGQLNEVTTSRNIVGNTFVFEVPPGTYEISHWFYRYYNAMSVDQKKPFLFTVKAGEVAYIGAFHGNSLTMCLSNRDNYTKDVAAIRKAHPFLGEIAITNLSQDIQFPGWPTNQSEDVFGKGLCKFQ